MRAYLVHFVCAAALCATPFLVFAWWVEPLDGDLTRVGRWAERDYGPNAPHPVIAIVRNDPDDRQSEILALGDSFSARNLWQSVVSGKRIRSYDYNGTDCFDDWLDAAIADRASTTIIVESVERSLVSRFARLGGCRHRNMIANDVGPGETAPTRPTWPPTLSLTYLVPTALHQLQARYAGEKVLYTARTVNVPLRPGCALFSSRRADRLLYARDDDDKLQWSVEDMRSVAANVKRTQDRVMLAGKTFLFIVAPDKSTVYAPCFGGAAAAKAAPDIWPFLVAAGVNTPNLGAAFRARIASVVDLYTPNNAHWSEAGYRLAGQEIDSVLNADSMARQHQKSTP